MTSAPISEGAEVRLLARLMDKAFAVGMYVVAQSPTRKRAVEALAVPVERGGRWKWKALGRRCSVEERVVSPSCATRGTRR